MNQGLGSHSQRIFLNVMMHTHGPLPVRWSDDQLLFYLTPFLTKWRKTFPNYRVAVVCPHPIETARWQTRLKAGEVVELTPQACLEHPSSGWDVVVLVDPNLTLDQLQASTELLTPYGMVLAVTRNLSAEWPVWQAHLLTGILDRLFCMGAHPQGGAAWWPWSGAQVWSKTLDFVQSIFPGKAQTNLKFGQAWVIQGYRSYSQTPLSLPLEQATVIALT